MDYFVGKRQSTKHRGKRLSQEQVNILERNFTSDKKLDPERKLQLAAELGVPPRQVAIWYQNKRARWRTQTLEFDYNALQLRLDATLAEKKVVERDLDRLRAELRSAHQVLALATNLAAAPPTSFNNNLLLLPTTKEAVSGSFEEGGSGSSNNSSSFNNGGDLDNLDSGRRSSHRCWEDDDDDEKNKALQLDDLYACMMFSNGSGRVD